MIFGSFKPRQMVAATLYEAIKAERDEYVTKYNELALATEAQANALTIELTKTLGMVEKLMNGARIIDIRKEGRTLIISFARNGNVSTIRAYACMSVDVAGLRQEAGLDQ